MLTPAPIPDLDTQFSRVLRSTLVLMGLVGVGIVFGSGSSFLWGVLVGLLVGLFNAFSLANRLKRLGVVDPPRARGFMNKGMAMRFTLIIVVLFVTSNVSWIDLHGIGAGILIPPLIAVFDLAVCAFKEAMASQAMQVKHKSKTEGGEKI